MKYPAHRFDENAALEEFDLWITPSLGQIKEAEQFGEFFSSMKQGLDELTAICKGFTSIHTCDPANIAAGFFELLGNENATEPIGRLFSVLMMLTGKTDNNLKCQFPVYLSQVLGDNEYPCIRRGGLTYTEVPRTIACESIAKTIGLLSEHPLVQRNLAEKYIRLLISEKSDQRQIWSVGLGYKAAIEADCGDDFLTTLVIFFKRGSITASMGHEPEQLLRERMVEWGMQPESDFNTQDVAIVDLLGQSIEASVKKRKYDFILPYQSRSAKTSQKLFIQCQFYAGDSGSVSHKNVDQTTATRNATLEKIPTALFVEYIDGAGYYSSLNGDLKRLLHMPTTHDFIQVRTAPVKLRRCLQEIGYLTPLEIAQLVLAEQKTLGDLKEKLEEQGYSKQEIEIACKSAIENNYLEIDGEYVEIKQDKVAIVRRYSLLDCLAIYGKPISSDRLTGNLIVAGFEKYHGMPQNELISCAEKALPGLTAKWANVQEAFDDIQWLIEHGFIAGK